MKNEVSHAAFLRTDHPAGAVVTGALVFMIRAVALVVFVLMSLAEPFLAAVLGALALGCFFVSVLFGFIFHAPFEHRLFVLGASVVFMLLYVIFRFAMMGVQRLLR